MVAGINIILSFGNKYVVLAWEFTGKPWWEWWLKRQENCVHIEILYIMESHCWKVRAVVSVFLTFKNIWHDWNYKNANNFLSFKSPKIYAYQIPLYFGSFCWKNDTFSFEIEASRLHIGLKWLCQPEIGYTTLHFLQFNTPTIILTLQCSSTKVRGYKKQSDSNTTTTSSSASASAVSAPDWDIALPLWTGRVDTKYVGIIEEQKQQFKQLWEELAEFDCIHYITLPENASWGKNFLRSSKKVSMTPTDHIDCNCDVLPLSLEDLLNYTTLMIKFCTNKPI